MIAVGLKCFRSMTALVKWVVPIITEDTSLGFKEALDITASRAFTIPSFTSVEVSALWLANISVPERTTASVWVPPTSIPIFTNTPFDSLKASWPNFQTKQVQWDSN